LQSGAESYHLLPYHCLDVAAVAHVWWKKSRVIQDRFCRATGAKEDKSYSWVMFFITLHDLGKFDVRFQLKAPNMADKLWSEFKQADRSESRNYWHGNYSSYWIFQDLAPRFEWDDDFSDEEKWDRWQPWINAVAGHHGVIPDYPEGDRPSAVDRILMHDQTARLAFIDEISALFLEPVGLSLDDDPPSINQDFLAGFCSICDWLGSIEVNGKGERRFSYDQQPLIFDQRPLFKEYFTQRLDIAATVLEESGLFYPVKLAGGMQALFPHYRARQLQARVDDIPLQAGLTLIEAATGSGKTEVALAYASRLLAAGMAESIIFALPTQATSNALFERLHQVSEMIYAHSNLLLAHGKARFNEAFIDLKRIGSGDFSQDRVQETEATVQCSQWLSQSRKRVFLGQMGVCTVDQVLISVLPVKHKFVRSFGLGKSVLIVDEVHAYDSYMYGLLQAILKRQKEMGGSALLLSATLPFHQKESLIEAWGGQLEEKKDGELYPLITHLADQVTHLALSESEQHCLAATKRQVQIELCEEETMQFDDSLLKQVIQAKHVGANVVLICNLVADAQQTWQRLMALGAEKVELFHSRFRFLDRQKKELAVLRNYGVGAGRRQGGILVATQVVEQSLDLDFDWMLTQLCPVDLLFQRLGRLHRHERSRPVGFESPRCSVVVPKNHNYALHKLIYGNQEAPNSRVLWRSEQLLRQQPLLDFPAVYRPMIERVYQQQSWLEEPEAIQAEYERFDLCQQAIQMSAWQLINSQTHFEDSDARAALLTRDGEMSLNVVPVIKERGRRVLLSGEVVSHIDEWLLAEKISVNTVPVPASWRWFLPNAEEGVIWLVMEKSEEGYWFCQYEKVSLQYSVERGLERGI